MSGAGDAVGGQWPDPNGSWVRRIRRWTLALGLAYLVLICLLVAGKLAGWDQASGISWLSIGLYAPTALLNVLVGIQLRRQA